LLKSDMPVRGLLILWLTGLWFAAMSPFAKGISIDVRPYCEISGGCGVGDFFVDHPEALGTLNFAAKAFEPFADSLLAIPANLNWTATFTNPETGNSGATVNNLSVPANTLILFAGGRDMSGGQAGEAGPGFANISLSRGQGIILGSSAADFATWGGSISFDTLNNGMPRNWHFGIDTLPAPGQTDFLTIALHELAHVFGFGTAASFDNLIAGNQFQGQAALELYGSAPAVDGDKDHWALNTTSPPYVNEPSAALTGTLLLGRRTPLTPLDYAAFRDIGWQVPDKLLSVHGDADEDGDIDGRDFLTWQRDYGHSGASAGDMNGNGQVDHFDLWLWRNNHGKTIAGGPLGASIQVPEPSGFMLSFSMLLAAGFRPAIKRMNHEIPS
jgi:hypothetical protein